MSYDRMYGQGGYGYSRPSFFRGFRFFPPVIKWLFIVNIAIWLLTGFFPFITKFFSLIPLGGVQIGPEHADFWPWQLLSYMFLHGGFMHLFFNMLALWMFGMEMENSWGSRKFIVYYLLCGLGAGIANLLVAPMLTPVGPTVGASGAVFGILIAFGMLFPDRPVYFYFLLPIPAKYFIAGYIGLELFYGVAGSPDGVAHFAHLGGAAVGFAYMLGEMNLVPVRSWKARFFGEIRNPFARPERYVWRDGHKVEVHDATFSDIGSGQSRTRNDETVDQEIIDAILDKISRGGYQSLTEEEKRVLNEASRKIH